MSLNFERDLKIDPDRLDHEFLNQPRLYLQYAEALAEANERLRRADQKVKVVRSELILTAVRDPEVLEVRGSKSVSPTAGNIEAYYRTHPDHIEAKEEWLAASKEVEMLQSAVSAFSQRKMSLEQLARLTVAGYCAMPNEPHDPSDFKDRMEKSRDQETTATRETVKERLNSRKRPRDED